MDVRLFFGSLFGRGEVKALLSDVSAISREMFGMLGVARTDDELVVVNLDGFGEAVDRAVSAVDSLRRVTGLKAGEATGVLGGERTFAQRYNLALRLEELGSGEAGVNGSVLDEVEQRLRLYNVGRGVGAVFVDAGRYSEEVATTLELLSLVKGRERDVSRLTSAMLGRLVSMLPVDVGAVSAVCPLDAGKAFGLPWENASQFVYGVEAVCLYSTDGEFPADVRDGIAAHGMAEIESWIKERGGEYGLAV